MRILNRIIFPPNLPLQLAKAHVVNCLSRVVRNKSLMTVILMNLVQTSEGRYTLYTIFFLIISNKQFLVICGDLITDHYWTISVNCQCSLMYTMLSLKDLFYLWEGANLTIFSKSVIFLYDLPHTITRIELLYYFQEERFSENTQTVPES